jgi:hypothetical protein
MIRPSISWIMRVSRHPNSQGCDFGMIGLCLCLLDLGEHPVEVFQELVQGTWLHEQTEPK